MALLSVFHYDFMLRAFAAGAVAALIAPMIGIFLVTRRYSFMADTLSHVSLAGVAVGVLLGTQPILTALAASVLTALAVDALRSRRQLLGESALALFLSGGLAVAAILISLSRGLNVSLSGILFGSITTVSGEELLLIVGLGAAAFATMLFLRKELFAIAFDEELAAAGGVPVVAVNRIFVTLVAVTVALSIRIVGTMLIGALMVIPVIAAMQCAKSFRGTLLLAIAMSFLSVLGGLFLSYFAGLSSGGTIVLLAIGFFLLSILWRTLSTRV